MVKQTPHSEKTPSMVSNESDDNACINIHVNGNIISVMIHEAEWLVYEQVNEDEEVITQYQ